MHLDSTEASTSVSRTEFTYSIMSASIVISVPNLALIIASTSPQASSKPKLGWNAELKVNVFIHVLKGADVSRYGRT